MKITFCLLLSLGSFVSLGALASASTVTVIGPCDAKPIYQFETSSNAPTLGDLTIEVFQAHQVPFDGSSAGIRSIAGSPVGDEAIEILSNERMRSYGWCVSVNGLLPDQMPDAVNLTGAQNQIVWFYAYSLYDRGEWKEICTPSYQIRTLPICLNR